MRICEAKREPELDVPIKQTKNSKSWRDEVSVWSLGSVDLRWCWSDLEKGFLLTTRGSFVTLTKKGKRAKENSERQQVIGERERERERERVLVVAWWGREKNPKQHGGGDSSEMREEQRGGRSVSVWSHEPWSPVPVCGGPGSRSRRRRRPRRRWWTRRTRTRNRSHRCSRAATPGCPCPTWPCPPRSPRTASGGARSASPAPPPARSAPSPPAPPPAPAPACATAASTRRGRPLASSR